jgi:hypothetical protein
MKKLTLLGMVAFLCCAGFFVSYGATVGSGSGMPFASEEVQTFIQQAGGTWNTAPGKEIAALPSVQNGPGGLTPEAALEYMLATENLVIVDIDTAYQREHFKGAVNIPLETMNAAEIESLFMDLPSGYPLILHSHRRLDMVIPAAYEMLKRLRPDIQEIFYVAGAPYFYEYNAWLENQRFEGAPTLSDANL